MFKKTYKRQHNLFKPLNNQVFFLGSGGRFRRLRETCRKNPPLISWQLLHGAKL